MGNAEPFDTPAVERGEEASEDVIESFVEMCLFDGKDVFGRGNDAEERGVSFSGLAEFTELFFHQAVAGGAGVNFCFEGGNESSKMF